MADSHAAPATSSDMDYPAHEATYRSFVALTKWSVISLAILLIGMAYFLG